MKKYTIPELFSRHLELREKHMKKEAWNKEAVSYEINLQRIAQASAMALANRTGSLSTEDANLLQIMATQTI